MHDFFYRKIVAYQLSKELVKLVYRLLGQFPIEEHTALCSQLRRAAVSVPSNIAEGMGRNSIKERIHFLEISYGSLADVMCQMEISQELGYIRQEQLEEVEQMVIQTGKTLSGLRNSLIEKQKMYDPNNKD